MRERNASWDVPTALRIVGVVLLTVSITTATGSALLYARTKPFSFLTTYLSDMGNTPVWPEAVFNSGMLVATPLRFLFLALVVTLLLHAGAPRWAAVTALVLGAVLFLGGVGMFAIPFGLARSIHMLSALVTFFGTVALFLLLAGLEWRLKLPRVLPASCVTAAAASLMFVTLLAMVGRAGITRDTPVMWEWVTFCAFVFWTGSHLVVLGRGQR